MIYAFTGKTGSGKTFNMEHQAFNMRFHIPSFFIGWLVGQTVITFIFKLLENVASKLQ